MLILSLMPTISFAATSEDVLAACDRALNAKIQEASLCGLGVQLRTDEMARITKENETLRSSNASLFKNPFVWAAIGVIFGAYAGARATR
jgi:hypothetical protein